MTTEREESETGIQVVRMFERETGFRDLQFKIQQRASGLLVVIFLASPTERHFAILNSVIASLGDDAPRATLQKRPDKGLLYGPEAKLLLQTISEILTVNRHNFDENFASRYVRSMVGVEDQIASVANHVIFGRRGSGKSSLLLYEMRRRAGTHRSSAWIDMQGYSRREDNATILSVLREIVTQGTPDYLDKHRASLFLERLNKTADEVSDKDLARLVPEAKNLFATSTGKDFAIFLDDFHVLGLMLQPRLLGFLYGFARGNRVSIKLSAVETFTRLWDAKTKTGLQQPHDVQSIRLDYNLTMADKATEHITGILDAHAQYCGLPSIRSLCTSADVLPRLVWVSAGVPRDALYLFSIAMTKASLRKQRFVTVQSVNVAASEVLSEKLSQRDIDSGADPDDEILNRIKAFCIDRQKNNAFLVEIKSANADLDAVRKLADLRLLHVVSEGITRKEAGRKYMALILDYGFYVGIRAARSVELFNKDSAIAKYNELRGLPVFA